MPKKLLYFLIFLVAMYTYPLLGQEVQYEYAKEKKDGEQTVLDTKEKANKLKVKTFETIDSLFDKSQKLQANTADSLNNFSNHLETKIQSKVDSLEQKLNQLQSKGSGLISSTVELPNLQKINLPGMPNLSFNQLNNLSQSDKAINSMISIERLTSNVSEKLSKIGSLENSDWIKADLPDYQQYTKDAQQYGEMIKDPSKIDQMANAQAAQLSEFQTLNNETKELAAMKELPESMLADLKRYQDAQAMKAEAKEMVVKQATDYFANHQDKLTEAQNIMSELKKKYSYVPDSKDLSTAVKANSMKNEPLKKRFVFGLGFQLYQTNPISLDLSPHVLYKFNKLFSAGISGTYRVSLGIENKKSVAKNTSTDVYGGSAILQHRVWKGFFAHTEYQYLSTTITDPYTGADWPTRRWNDGLLLGIGKQMSFSEALRGQLIFTYDFLHDQYSPNPKAWNIKFAFQLGRFKLKDIHL